jgi:hypothetical protein
LLLPIIVHLAGVGKIGAHQCSPKEVAGNTESLISAWTMETMVSITPVLNLSCSLFGSPASKHIRLINHKDLANRGVKDLLRLRLRLAKTFTDKVGGGLQYNCEELD